MMKKIKPLLVQNILKENGYNKSNKTKYSK